MPGKKTFQCRRSENFCLKIPALRNTDRADEGRGEVVSPLPTTQSISAPPPQGCNVDIRNRGAVGLGLLLGGDCRSDLLELVVFDQGGHTAPAPAGAQGPPVVLPSYHPPPNLGTSVFSLTPHPPPGVDLGGKIVLLTIGLKQEKIPPPAGCQLSPTPPGTFNWKTKPIHPLEHVSGCTPRRGGGGVHWTPQKLKN